MFRVAVISCLLSVAISAPFSAELDSEWEAYKTTHNKQYQGDAETIRYYNQLSISQSQVHLKLLIYQSKFSGPRKFTLRYRSQFKIIVEM